MRKMAAGFMACLVVAGCSLPTIDKQADAKARTLYEQVRMGADLGPNADLAPSLRTPRALAQLAAVKASLPEGAPTSVVNRSWSINAGTGGTQAVLVHAYAYPSRTVLAQTVLAKGKGGAWRIIGFHVTFEEPAADGPPPPVTVTRPPQVT